MCDVGIAIHITVKVHSISRTSAFHYKGFVCGILEAGDTSYIDYKAKFAISMVWEGVVTEQVQLQRQLLCGWWLREPKPLEDRLQILGSTMAHHPGPAVQMPLRIREGFLE